MLFWAQKCLKCLRPTAGLMYRFSEYLPQNILILMYNSFVLSKLNYRLEVWGNTADTHLNKLQPFQKKIPRIIFQTHYLAPSYHSLKNHKFSK